MAARCAVVPGRCGSARAEDAVCGRPCSCDARGVRSWLALIPIACKGTSPASSPTATESVQAPVAPWRVPAGWRSETIPFPLEFAPSLAHRGVEELRFAPGFLEPGAPGFWSYAFTWRTEDPAQLDGPALAAELTDYFRGLVAAVDQQGKITAREAIVVQAVAEGSRFGLTAHVIDPFRTFQPVELVGWAERTACAPGNTEAGARALWVFVFAPAASPLRGELEELAAEARCRQPVP
jgi:hypothetical protein